MPEAKDRLVVIGAGNLLLADEGVGIHAVNELKKKSFPPFVDVVDGGTAGLDLLYWLEDADYALIIDCVEAAAEPGSIFRIPAEELISDEVEQVVSLHDVSLPQVLSIGKKTNRLPPTVVFGIQPETLSLSVELSPSVEKSLPRLLQLVEAEIEAFCARHR